MSKLEELNTALRALGALSGDSQEGVEIPPPFVGTLGMKVLDFSSEFLEAEFPVDMKLANPLGAYLGGMTCALVDAACGPLSYLACGRPAVTTEFTMTFLRPVTKRDAALTVRAEVVSRSRTLIVMEASARNPRGKLVARARTTSFILDRRAAA
ncbi:MAG: PaaI family thioesterase [Elusimicrobiota bacterium]